MTLIDSIWSGKNKLYWFLVPFSWLYGWGVLIRRMAYKYGFFSTYTSSMPIVVVGNLSVGGNGKTPLVLYLIEQFKQQNKKVAVITRGYGGKSHRYPFIIDDSMTVSETGDEPLLIYQRTQIPVAVSPKRKDGIKLLERMHPDLDVIISDDGLQHYQMNRQIEIVVIDAQKQLGNGYYLPAGPLRETKSRLESVDFVIMNGEYSKTIKPLNIQKIYTMELAGNQFKSLLNDEIKRANQMNNAVAIAGIGNPIRFFMTLNQLGVDIAKTVAFPDHHHYKQEEITALINDEQPVLMTEKDKVKCIHFAQKNWWYLPVNAHLPSEFMANLLSKLESVHSVK